MKNRFCKMMAAILIALMLVGILSGCQRELGRTSSAESTEQSLSSSVSSEADIQQKKELPSTERYINDVVSITPSLNDLQLADDGRDRGGSLIYSDTGTVTGFHNMYLYNDTLGSASIQDKKTTVVYNRDSAPQLMIQEKNCDSWLEALVTWNCFVEEYPDALTPSALLGRFLTDAETVSGGIRQCLFSENGISYEMYIYSTGTYIFLARFS